jgi:nitrate/nitrite transporter NarK
VPCLLLLGVRLSFLLRSVPVKASFREQLGTFRNKHTYFCTILTLSTTVFTVMFAVWLMFGVLGIPIRKEFGLTEVQFGWLTAIAILNGSIWRLLFALAAPVRR